jgi:GntR family transcriptional regulator
MLTNKPVQSLLEKNNIPLYFQLEQIIKSKILTGEFILGDKIPTEKDFCKTYQVSSITARQAILNLVNEGLLVRRQGKGTFVKEGFTKIKNIKTLRLSGNLNNILPEGLKAQDVKVLDVTKVKAPRRVARLLDIEEGKEVIQVRRTRSDNRIPVSYIKNYVRPEIGERIKREDLYLYPMLDILRNRLRIPLTGGIQYIEAIVADYDIASALLVNICSPILYLETVIFEKHKKPVELAQTFYRPDQFRYTVELRINGGQKQGI